MTDNIFKDIFLCATRKYLYIPMKLFSWQLWSTEVFDTWNLSTIGEKYYSFTCLPFVLLPYNLKSSNTLDFLDREAQYLV